MIPVEFKIESVIPATEEAFVKVEIEPSGSKPPEYLKIQGWALIDKYPYQDKLLPLVRSKHSGALKPVFETKGNSDYFDTMYKVIKVVTEINT